MKEIAWKPTKGIRLTRKKPNPKRTFRAQGARRCQSHRLAAPKASQGASSHRSGGFTFHCGYVELQRQDALREVKRERRPGARDPRGKTAERDGLLADAVSQEGDQDDGYHQRNDEEGNGVFQVIPSDPAMLPPGIKEDQDREHHHRCLAEHGGQEQAEGGQVIVDLFAPVVIDPGAERQQERRHRQRILQFRHPGHRFDHDGMDGKKKTPRARRAAGRACGTGARPAASCRHAGRRS